jgi:hypothetical protein
MDRFTFVPQVRDDNPGAFAVLRLLAAIPLRDLCDLL